MVAFNGSPFKLFSRKLSKKTVQAPSCERPNTTQRTLFLSFVINNCFQIMAQCRAATNFSKLKQRYCTSSPIFEKTVRISSHHKSPQIMRQIRAMFGVSTKVPHCYQQHRCSYYSVIAMIDDAPLKVHQTNKKTLVTFRLLAKVPYQCWLHYHR